MYEEILSRFRPYDEVSIGSGGYANTFKGRSAQLGMDVAIKILKNEHRSNSNILKRFQNEAQIIAPVDHHNIIRIYDNQLDDYYFVMQLLDESLSERLKNRGGTLSQEQVIRLAIEMANALKTLATLREIGKRNIIHRDIKPSNIMFRYDDNGAVLIDFGIAIYQDEIPQSDEGTYQYMSPEQFEKGHPLDSRSDMYLLGVVLYKVSTGHLPFKGKDKETLKRQHQEEQPLKPSQYFPAINPDIEQVIIKLLAKKPDDRYQSPQALLSRLEEIRENYKNLQIQKYLKLRLEKNLPEAKEVCQRYLKDVDPQDRYFDLELKKTEFILKIEEAKIYLTRLDVGKAKNILEEATKAIFENDPDTEYAKLGEHIRIVDNCYKELLDSLHKGDVDHAQINFSHIEKIISSYDRKEDQKLDSFKRLLAVINTAENFFKNKDYSSALREYQNAQNMVYDLHAFEAYIAPDRSSTSFIDKQILFIDKEINQLKLNLIDETQKTFKEYLSKIDDIGSLKENYDAVVSGGKIYDSKSIHVAKSVYCSLMEKVGRYHKNQENYDLAFDYFTKAKSLANEKDAIKLNRMMQLMYILKTDKRGQYPNAKNNCELIIEILENCSEFVDENSPDLIEENSLVFLKQKKIELEVKLKLQAECEAVGRKIRRGDFDDAKKLLNDLKNKLEKTKETYPNIDLAIFQDNILKYEKEISEKNQKPIHEPDERTPINAASSYKKRILNKKALIGVAIIAGIVLMVPAIRWITETIPPKPIPQQLTLFELRSVPEGTMLYIDNILKSLTGTVYQESLAVGKHEIRPTHNEYTDTTFTATISPDSQNLFLLEKWKLKPEGELPSPKYGFLVLTINPQPDTVFPSAGLELTKTNENVFHFRSELNAVDVQILKQEYQAEQIEFQLTENQTVSQTIQLVPDESFLPTFGNLDIIIHPFATIHLDGNLVGENVVNTSINSISTGDHRLSISHHTYGTLDTLVAISTDQTIDFFFDYDPECGHLTITVLRNNQPIWADILINNQIVSSGQFGFTTTKVRGAYMVSAQRRDLGVQSEPQQVIVEKGGNHFIEIHL